MSNSVYFAEAAGRIKIGFSSNVEARLRSLSTASPEKLTLIHHLPGSRYLEKIIHQELKSHRLNGEWFSDCIEVREAIEKYKLSPPAVEPVQNSININAMLADAVAIGGDPDCNIKNVGERFFALMGMDLFDRLHTAATLEKRQGLPAGTLMERVIRGLDRRRQFSDAWHLLMISYDAYGRLLDRVQRVIFEPGIDLTPYYAVASQLITPVEIAFESFRKEREESAR